MTAGQRRAHLVLWLVLGPLALLGLALAVVFKPAEPVQDGPLPGAEAPTTSDADHPDAEQPGARP